MRRTIQTLQCVPIHNHNINWSWSMQTNYDFECARITIIKIDSILYMFSFHAAEHNTYESIYNICNCITWMAIEQRRWDIGTPLNGTIWIEPIYNWNTLANVLVKTSALKSTLRQTFAFGLFDIYSFHSYRCREIENKPEQARRSYRFWAENPLEKTQIENFIEIASTICWNGRLTFQASADKRNAHLNSVPPHNILNLNTLISIKQKQIRSEIEKITQTTIKQIHSKWNTIVFLVIRHDDLHVGGGAGMFVRIVCIRAVIIVLVMPNLTPPTDRRSRREGRGTLPTDAGRPLTSIAATQTHSSRNK